MITSKVEGYTNKSIFIPAAGYKDENGTLYSNNEDGYYWSNSLSADYPSQTDFLLILQPGQIRISSTLRTEGASVRPVYDDN